MDNLLWYHLGKQHGGGGGSSGGSSTATEDILGEVQFSDFAESADFPGLGIVSMKAFGSDLESFEIVEGENYTVVWNGTEYKVTAQDSSGVIPGSLLLGNGERVMLSGKSEPFAIGWTPAMVIFFSFDGKTTNKVRIYKTVLENAETTTVTFAKDNQIVRPSEDGKALSEVVIMKPDTLLPENIAEGIDIAGIIGTLVAGGGGGNVKIKVGKKSYSSYFTGQSIYHQLGVVPDFIYCVATGQYTPSQTSIVSVAGISTKLKEASGYQSAYCQSGCARNSSTYYQILKQACIDTTDTTFPINNTNTNLFKIGCADFKVLNDVYWIAIGGLT